MNTVPKTSVLDKIMPQAFYAFLHFTVFHRVFYRLSRRFTAIYRIFHYSG